MYEFNFRNMLCLLVFDSKIYYYICNLSCQKVVFTEKRKGGLLMTVGDAIINIVDKLIAEKEKNFELQCKLNEQQNQQEDEQSIKD